MQSIAHRCLVREATQATMQAKGSEPYGRKRSALHLRCGGRTPELTEGMRSRGALGAALADTAHVSAGSPSALGV